MARVGLCDSPLRSCSAGRFQIFDSLLCFLSPVDRFPAGRNFVNVASVLLADLLAHETRGGFSGRSVSRSWALPLSTRASFRPHMRREKEMECDSRIYHGR